MEAFEFLKEYKRMCRSYQSCVGCPLEDSNVSCNINYVSNEDALDAIGKIDSWSKEHPNIVAEE